MMRSLHSDSVHTSATRCACQLQIITVLILLYRTPNKRDLFPFGTKRNLFAHSTVAGSMTFLWSITYIPVAANSLAIDTALYDALHTGRAISSVSSIRCFAVLKRPRWQSHMAVNFSGGSRIVENVLSLSWLSILLLISRGWGARR